MKENSYLFETVVNKVIEEPVVEVKEEAGEKIEIKRNIKKLKPVKIAILKPDRKLFKAADIFYAKTLADYLKAGLLPYSLVAKRYANDGGALSEEQKARLVTLQNDSTTLQKDFFSIVGETSDEFKEKKKHLLTRINQINAEIGAISNAYSDIFENTAEVKSRNDTVEWWALFLIYIDETDKGYVPLFADGDYENKLKMLEVIEERQSDFYDEVIKRLSYLISFWFTSRNIVNKTDFDTMETVYLDNISSYKLPEIKEEIKVTTDKPQEKGA